MRQPLFVIVHALLFLLQPVLSIPTTLFRRVTREQLQPAQYPGFTGRDGFTFFAEDTLPANQPLLRDSGVDFLAGNAFNIIRRIHNDDSHEVMPLTMIVAALYVPNVNKIYYATQPRGNGRAYFNSIAGAWNSVQGVHVNGHWPGLLNNQQIMHAEGHAIFKAIQDGAQPHFPGSYMAVWGSYNGERGKKIYPCQGTQNHCMGLLGGFGFRERAPTERRERQSGVH